MKHFTQHFPQRPLTAFQLGKWGRRLGKICCMGMVLLLVSCLKTTPQDPDTRIPIREVTRFPGLNFDHVLFGYKTELFPAQFNPANVELQGKYVWGDLLRGENFLMGRPVQLIPAHQADLMVALSLQDVYSAMPQKCVLNSGEEFVFLFVDQGSKSLAWARYLQGCLLLETNTGTNIFLTQKGMARLDRIKTEVVLHY